MEVLLSLLAGLMIAAVLQLLLTNLGIALGLTVLDWSPSVIDASATNSRSSTADTLDDSESSSPEISLPFTHLIGLGVASSLSLVMFAAALLATEFSQIAEPRRGGILGLILWSAYWLLFLWLSSTTLSAIADSILGTAIAGGRRLITTIRHSLQSSPPEPAEAASPQLKALVAEVQQIAELKQQLPQLLMQQREMLIQELSDRTELSAEEATAVVEELEPTLTPSPSMAAEMTTSSMTSGLWSQLELPSWQQMLQRVLDQVDLSDLDAESVWHQVQAFRGQPEVDTPAHSPEFADAILQDARDYIRHAPDWSLNPEVLKDEFHERLYDPQAAAASVHQQLKKLSPQHYVEWLQERGDLAADRLEDIAHQMREVQQTELAQIDEQLEEPDWGPALATVQDKLLAYCRYTHLDSLTPEHLSAKIQTLREAQNLPEPTAEMATQLDLETITTVLSRRRGITPGQVQALSQTLQAAWTVDDAARDRNRLERVTQILDQTLQTVDWSTISLEDLKPDLLTQLRSLDLQGEMDWEAIGARLQLPDATKAALTSWLQEVGQDFSRVPRRWIVRAGESSQSIAQQLAREVRHYLQFQDKAALEPAQIAKDLTHIFKGAMRLLPSPQLWPDLSDLNQLLSAQALRQALEKRRDMTVEDIQQVVDWFESGWQQATQQIGDWSQALWTAAGDRLTADAETLDDARRQVVEQIAATQQAVQDQAAAVKADLQRQADAARRQVAIAAWWLFLSLVSSGSAAVAAGWLAVKY
mgnify:CR=1 FL=1